jgi:polysaccharide biosynthesis/export protein
MFDKMKFAVMAAVLAAAMCAVYGQSAPKDTALLKQYLKQKGMSEVEVQNLLKAQQKKKTGPMTKEELRATDTVEAAAAQPSQDIAVQLSVYESMIRDKIIDPDSLLKKLTIYGLDVFAGSKPSTFAPNDAGSTPADYVVGSNDEVLVTLWGRINEEYRMRVDRDGKINIPHIGAVPVAGLPFSALQKNILDRVQTIEGVEATVSLGELRSIGVFIVGEVRSPGYYTVSGLSNVTNALFAAGGPTRRGSLRNVQLKRNGNAIATIDFYDFLMSGRDNTSLHLKSGDVIMVPIVKKMVAIAGNVRRSALYEIKPNTSLKDALLLAGGVSPAAWTNRIQIERYKDNQFQVVLDLISEKGQPVPEFEVQDGDIIKLFPVMEKNKNSVYLSGNVLRPGKYEFKEGMKVSDLLPDYHSLLPETYFEYAIVMRQDPPSFLNRIMPFVLKDAMEDHSSKENMALQARDEVMVYSRDYFEPERNVFIEGAVTNPGVQKLLENMKIRDLIIKAGGLFEEASPERGELYRRAYDKDTVVTEKIDFCVSCALADDPKHNMLLRKFDRVYIRTKKGWEQERRVTLKGEFVYPGDYVIFEKETMGHIIERAGGFTGEAYLPAVVVTRVSVRKLEQKRLDEYISRLEADAVKMTTELAAKGQQVSEAQQLLAQQELLFSKLKSMESVGRIVIDLTNPSIYKDFNLEDGDTIFVPKPSGTVSVIGEVFNPATFRFEGERAKAGYYLDIAGGLKENADRKNMYVIKANGSVISNQNVDVMNVTLAPGDAIVVPQKMEFVNRFKLFMETLDAIFKIASVIAIVATLIIASKR